MGWTSIAVTCLFFLQTSGVNISRRDLKRICTPFESVHLPDLAQLLIEVRGVDQCPLLDFGVKEVLVPCDKIGSQKLLHLNRNIHGNRNDEVEEHHEGQEVREHLKVLEGEKKHI